MTLIYANPLEVEAVGTTRASPTAPPMAKCPVCGGEGVSQNPWSPAEEIECPACEGEGMVLAEWRARYLAQWHLPVALIDTIGSCCGCLKWAPTAPWRTRNVDGEMEEVEWCAQCALGNEKEHA